MKEDSFPEIRRYLAPTFKAVLASTEVQINAVVNDPEIQGVVLDLDSIEDGAPDEPAHLAPFHEEDRP